MKPLFATALAVTLLGISANAQVAGVQPTTPAVPIIPPVTTPISADLSPVDQKALDDAQSLARVARLWSKPLDWKETSSSTANVVSHITKALGANAPVIEVRGKDDSRSTFVLPQATLGSVLCSLAELANRRIWVFPGRLVMASEDALTDEERAAVKNRSAGEWKQDFGWDGDQHLEQVTMKIGVADMKQRIAAKGQMAPLPGPPMPTKPSEEYIQFASYELPFGELNPVSQGALQELVNISHYRDFVKSVNPPPVIAPDVLVCLDATQNNGLFFFKEMGTGKHRLKYYGWNVMKPQPLPSL